MLWYAGPSSPNDRWLCSGYSCARGAPSRSSPRCSPAAQQALGPCEPLASHRRKADHLPPPLALLDPCSRHSCPSCLCSFTWLASPSYFLLCFPCPGWWHHYRWRRCSWLHIIGWTPSPSRRNGRPFIVHHVDRRIIWKSGTSVQSHRRTAVLTGLCWRVQVCCSCRSSSSSGHRLWTCRAYPSAYENHWYRVDHPQLLRSLTFAWAYSHLHSQLSHS